MTRWRTCATRGCSTATPVGQTYCAECARTRDQRRPSAADRGYDAQWQRKSAAFVNGKSCADCPAPATVADHDPTPRAELVRQGVTDPDADRHLVPRCKPCHSRRTVKHDGGFGRESQYGPPEHTAPAKQQAIVVSVDAERTGR